MNEHIWYGFIEKIHNDYIYCTLRKEYHLDKELWYPIEKLTEIQKNMLCIGLCMRLNLENEIIEFMNSDESWL